jgi:hypothetical protein
MARHRLPINDEKFNLLKSYMTMWINLYRGNSPNDDFLIELCKHVEFNNYCLNSHQVKELIQIRFDIHAVIVDDVGAKYLECYGNLFLHIYYTFNGRMYELDEPLLFGQNYRFRVEMHEASRGFSRTFFASIE